MDGMGPWRSRGRSWRVDAYMGGCLGRAGQAGRLLEDPGMSISIRGRFTTGTGLDWTGVSTEHCLLQRQSALPCQRSSWAGRGEEADAKGSRRSAWRRSPRQMHNQTRDGNAQRSDRRWAGDTLAAAAKTWRTRPTPCKRPKDGERRDGSDAGQAAKSAGDGSVVFVRAIAGSGRVSASRHTPKADGGLWAAVSAFATGADSLRRLEGEGPERDAAALLWRASTCCFREMLLASAPLRSWSVEGCVSGLCWKGVCARNPGLC